VIFDLVVAVVCAMTCYYRVMHASIFRNDYYDDISDFVYIYKDTELYVLL